MPKFAVLNNDLVTNTIVADSKEIAEAVIGSNCIEYTNANPAQIGGTYDEESNLFINPPVETTEEATPTPEIEAPVND